MDMTLLLPTLGIGAQYGTAVIAGAAVLAAVLPQPAADAWWAPLRRLVDLLGQNFGNAVNAPTAPPPSR